MVRSRADADTIEARANYTARCAGGWEGQLAAAHCVTAAAIPAIAVALLPPMLQLLLPLVPEQSLPCHLC